MDERPRGNASSGLNWKQFGLPNLERRYLKKNKFVFVAREIAGSLGDLPLFFIFFVAFHQYSGLNPLAILFWSGVAHIIVGLVFKAPVPLQPMKAIGLYTIAHPISQGDLLSSGLLLGVLLLAFN